MFVGFLFPHDSAVLLGAGRPRVCNDPDPARTSPAEPAMKAFRMRNLTWLIWAFSCMPERPGRSQATSATAASTSSGMPAACRPPRSSPPLAPEATTFQAASFAS